jgi:rare lipoprotein A
MHKLLKIIFIIILGSFALSFTIEKRVCSLKTWNYDTNDSIQNKEKKFFKKNAHASYYSDKLNGRKTANGEKFDNTKYTAAHKKLKFGTKVKVTNTVNNKSVIVTINDRGPFTKGREIDLTKKAFMEIAKNKQRGGLIVHLEIVD